MLNIEPPLVRSSNRLEAYSDALFSIIATVMIVPVSHTELPEDENLASSFVTHLLAKILIYVYTFLLISFFWGVHTKLYKVLENVDEFMVLLNLALMMVVTFLPFTFTLLGSYPTDSLAIVIFFCSMILISLIQIMFVVHAFRTPGMLKMELRENETRVKQRNKMLVNIASPLFFALIGLIFAYIVPVVSLVFLVLMIFATPIRTGLAKCYSKIRTGSDPEVPDYVSERSTLRERLMNDTITKERIEFFSDGVFAIVATLIILDICENNIPDYESVKQAGSLPAALSPYSPMYLAYLGTFCTVALQWYVHHSLLHYLKELNKLMVWLNQMCLLCIGLSPLAFQLTSNFDRHTFENNESVALRFNCIVIFMASMFQAAIWVAALFDQERHLAPEGRHHGDDHGYMTAKLSIYPLLALTMYALTCSLDNISIHVFVGMELSTIGLFILLGLFFSQIRVHHKETKSSKNKLKDNFEKPLRV